MASIDALPAGVQLFGGIPTHTDLAPSIVFIAVWALIAGAGILRLVQRSARTCMLATPLILASIRIAAFVIRTIQSNGSCASTVRRR